MQLPGRLIRVLRRTLGAILAAAKVRDGEVGFTACEEGEEGYEGEDEDEDEGGGEDRHDFWLCDLMGVRIGGREVTYGSDYVRMLAYLGVANVIGNLGLYAYRPLFVQPQV